MTLSSEVRRYDKNERDFLSVSLSRRIFGAIHAALMTRKRDSGLTRAEFGDRIDRDKTGVSKILKGPGNWTIATISDVANALDLDIEFYFVDRYNRFRTFTDSGIQFAAPVMTNCPAPYFGASSGKFSGVTMAEVGNPASSIASIGTSLASVGIMGGIISGGAVSLFAGASAQLGVASVPPGAGKSNFESSAPLTLAKAS